MLVDGDLVLTESAAIVTYLGDKYGGLTPAFGTAERARYNEWDLLHPHGARRPHAST